MKILLLLASIFFSAASLLAQCKDFDFDFQVNHPTCVGSETGSVGIAVRGGHTIDRVEWEDGVNNTSRVDLGQGIYSVTVYSSDGCQLTKQVELIASGKEELSLDVNGNNLSLKAKQGSITRFKLTLIQNGKVISENEYSGNSISNLESGSYAVEALTNVGCFLSGSVTIN